MDAELREQLTRAVGEVDAPPSNRFEARRRAREHEAQLMTEVEAGDSPVVAWEKLSSLLDEAMRELNDRDREAVLLRFFARRPFAEIGATLRVSEDAARMRVERALEKLRGLLMKRGVTSTGAALGVVLANQAVVAAPRRGFLHL